MSYAAIGAFSGDSNFFQILESKLLAYPHLKWVAEYLLNTNTLLETVKPKEIASNILNTNTNTNTLLEKVKPKEIASDIAHTKEGLNWSPLSDMKGSCFVTVYKKDNNYKATYSCFGSWENDTNNLLKCVKNATETVSESRWAKANPPVNKDVLNKLKNYKLNVTLIEPISKWKQISFEQIQKGRGYVFYNKNTKKVGMTYLPSVWDTLPDKQEFKKGLEEKHQNVYANSQGFELYEYESLTWEYLANAIIT